MAPRRHDDKRRTAVRMRWAGPGEGAVKGPASISLVYRDSRGSATERGCAEKVFGSLVVFSSFFCSHPEALVGGVSGGTLME